MANIIINSLTFENANLTTNQSLSCSSSVVNIEVSQPGTINGDITIILPSYSNGHAYHQIKNIYIGISIAHCRSHPLNFSSSAQPFTMQYCYSDSSTGDEQCLQNFGNLASPTLYSGTTTNFDNINEGYQLAIEVNDNNIYQLSGTAYYYADTGYYKIHGNFSISLSGDFFTASTNPDYEKVLLQFEASAVLPEE